MRIIRSNQLEFVPASHEDPINPGVLKKILFKKGDLVEGAIQMINWAKLPMGRSFEKHYHTTMEEVYIILSGKAKIIIDKEEEYLEKGDAVLIPIKAAHQMTNISDEEVNYIALGIATGENGKTVNV